MSYDVHVGGEIQHRHADELLPSIASNDKSLFERELKLYEAELEKSQNLSEKADPKPGAIPLSSETMKPELATSAVQTVQQPAHTGAKAALPPPERELRSRDKLKPRDRFADQYSSLGPNKPSWSKK